MLFFGGYELEVVSQQKVVGYILDSRFTWAPMVNALQVKARKRLAALVWLRRFLDNSNMQKMYEMYVH